MKIEVERWRQSGLSQREFCQQLGMKVATFGYWVSRCKEEKKTGFVRLAPAGAPELEVTYPNGVRLKIPAGDLSLLSKLIRLY